MPRTVLELLEQAGGDAEDAVSSACKRWRDQVRACIVSVTGLKLTQRHALETEQLNISIRIDPGLPEPLREMETEEILSNDRWATELIGLAGHDIERLQDVCQRLRPLFGHLGNIPAWGHRAESYGETLSRTESIARELAKYVAMAGLLRRMLIVNEDVLGRYGTPSELWPTRGCIEIFWLVIGATARLLGVEIEGLSIAALAHEFAHAYTHLGMDLDGHWWEEGFWNSDRAVKEGLAQYYTHRALELLVQRRGNTSAWNAYQAVLAKQQEFGSKNYTCHLRWVERYSPEILRATLLTVRNSGRPTNFSELSATLEGTAQRLQRQAHLPQ